MLTSFVLCHTKATLDLVALIAGIVSSALRNAGQTCVCANRVFVHDDVHDKLSGACYTYYFFYQAVWCVLCLLPAFTSQQKK